jgi:hypothetical protein
MFLESAFYNLVLRLFYRGRLQIRSKTNSLATLLAYIMSVSYLNARMSQHPGSLVDAMFVVKLRTKLLTESVYRV